MELKDTIEMMNSEDYKERFKACLLYTSQSPRDRG